MRLVRKEEKKMPLKTEKMGESGVSYPPKPPESEKGRVLPEFGKEDIIMVIVLFILAVGYVRGQLTIQEFLTYMGVSSAGGIWGMVSGLSSTK